MISLLILAAIVAGVLLVDRPEVALRAAPPDAIPRAPSSRGLDGPESRVAPAPIVSRAAATIPRPTVAPHRGVRGAVASPRVLLPEGGFGVDPSAWVASVFALVPRDDGSSVDRIGIVTSRRPSSARGDFEIDLPVGVHLILVEHRCALRGNGVVVEAWHARVEITPSQRTPVDLGAHEFASELVAGRVVGADASPVAEVPVWCSDEGSARDDGVRIRGVSDGDGRFAFSLSGRAGTAAACDVDAVAGIARAVARGVTPGADIELVLRSDEPVARVVVAVDWHPGLEVWVYALDRRLFAMSGGGRRPGSGFEFIRDLPRGRYRVELFRDGAAAGDFAAASFEVHGSAPLRVDLTPAWVPARAAAGLATPGARVAWITRASDGSTFERAWVIADEIGRFRLSRIAPTGVLLSTEGRIRVVEPGSADADVGRW